MAVCAFGPGCSATDDSEQNIDHGTARDAAGEPQAPEAENEDGGDASSEEDGDSGASGSDLDASARDAGVSDSSAADAGRVDAGTGISSSFGSDDEGWTITGDAKATGVKPEFGGADAGSAGLISAKDDVTGGIWYFTAPAKYLGDQSLVFGHSLSFDLKVTPITNPFEAADVVLEAGSIRFDYDLPRDPGTDWTHYVVPLDGTGWKRAGAAADAGTVSVEDFRTLLSHLTALRIRGEYHSGPDTGSLANVHFGE